MGGEQDRGGNAGGHGCGRDLGLAFDHRVQNEEQSHRQVEVVFWQEKQHPASNEPTNQ